MQAPKIKKCSRCSQSKDISDFYKNKASKDGYKSLCKVCEIKGKTKFPTREQNKDRVLRSKYGITFEEYTTLLKSQNHKCRICGIHRDHCDKALAVDHDHSNGAIRGLLCMGCNTGIGLFKENPHFLLEAINYLNTSRED